MSWALGAQDIEAGVLHGMSDRVTPLGTTPDPDLFCAPEPCDGLRTLLPLLA